MKIDNSIPAAAPEAKRKKPHPISVGVFRSNQPSKSAPDYRVTREDARELVMTGQAIWINSARSVRLLPVRRWRVGKSRYSGHTGCRLEAR
jgi:hypothetical protein